MMLCCVDWIWIWIRHYYDHTGSGPETGTWSTADQNQQQLVHWRCQTLHLASHWSRQITWPEYWPVIGPDPCYHLYFASFGAVSHLADAGWAQPWPRTSSPGAPDVTSTGHGEIFLPYLSLKPLIKPRGIEKLQKYAMFTGYLGQRCQLSWFALSKTLLSFLNSLFARDYPPLSVTLCQCVCIFPRPLANSFTL